MAATTARLDRLRHFGTPQLATLCHNMHKAWPPGHPSLPAIVYTTPEGKLLQVFNEFPQNRGWLPRYRYRAGRRAEAFGPPGPSSLFLQSTRHSARYYFRVAIRSAVVSTEPTQMAANTAAVLHVALDGLPCQITCTVGRLGEHLTDVFERFSAPAHGGRFAATGLIRPYVEPEVMRHMSPSARSVPCEDCGLELYHEQERFWLVDEHWGIAEINFLRSQWRAWILPGADADFPRLLDSAVLWPMAQILRCRGLHMLPALSATRDGWGVLILSSFALGAELSCLAHADYRIVGQRWTAMRVSDQSVDMFAMPGWAQLAVRPAPGVRSIVAQSDCVDLTGLRPDRSAASAPCSAVIICQPGRRSERHVAELTVAAAHEELRRAWPIMEIHPMRRPLQLAGHLARHCRCFQVQLSRRPEDLAYILDEIQATTPQQPPPIAAWISPEVRAASGSAQETRR